MIVASIVADSLRSTRAKVARREGVHEYMMFSTKLLDLVHRVNTEYNLANPPCHHV